MNQFKQIFKKVDGIEIIKQYARSHILIFALVETVILGLSRKSLEIVRLATTNKKLMKLRRRYKRTIEVYLDNKSVDNNQVDSDNRKIWVCWFQGLEKAPEIVKCCYKSICENITDREIILITQDNYSDYVNIPNYILEKYKNGIISHAHFADILRLELLIKYGGTWIDSTVLVTSNQIPHYQLDDDLFVFRSLKPGLDGHAVSISNWFITSKPHNEILELTLFLLYQYWKKKNRLIDYYIFHLFFELATEYYPQQWKKVVPFTNESAHILLLRFFEEYDEHLYSNVVKQTSFHKLSHKFSDDEAQKENTYYSRIMKGSNEREMQDP